MNNNNQLGILDVINLLSFYVGILNLEENLTQGDKQELLENLNNSMNTILQEIHEHLTKQDSKLDIIIKELEGIKNA